MPYPIFLLWFPFDGPHPLLLFLSGTLFRGKKAAYILETLSIMVMVVVVVVLVGHRKVYELEEVKESTHTLIFYFLFLILHFFLVTGDRRTSIIEEKDGERKRRVRKQLYGLKVILCGKSRIYMVKGNHGVITHEWCVVCMNHFYRNVIISLSLFSLALLACKYYHFSLDFLFVGIKRVVQPENQMKDYGT